MVSLRRRRLLGLCSGKNSFIAPLPRFWDSQAASGNHNTRSVSVHPSPYDGINLLQERGSAKTGFGSLSLSGSTSSKEQTVQMNPAQPIKRRKRHRRKLVQNQEPCLMRGVYFKNLKWQAAIKVDKKQIHLGTVGSQQEAAHLYDRAAFMCGREPNFELAEEEKEKLSKFNWDEFLAFTRRSITNKKQKRKVGAAPEKIYRPAEAEENSEWERKHRTDEQSASDDAALDSSES